MTDAIKPFRIAVGDDVLEDLRARLRKTRWPEAEPVDDWSQGVPLKWIREICRYWAEDYDWRRREELLNRVRNRGDGSWPDQMTCNHYSTAMALICLQIPNNYLPIMQK